MVASSASSVSHEEIRAGAARVMPFPPGLSADAGDPIASAPGASTEEASTAAAGAGAGAQSPHSGMLHPDSAAPSAPWGGGAPPAAGHAPGLLPPAPRRRRSTISNCNGAQPALSPAPPRRLSLAGAGADGARAPGRGLRCYERVPGCGAPTARGARAAVLRELEHGRARLALHALVAGNVLTLLLWPRGRQPPPPAPWAAALYWLDAVTVALLCLHAALLLALGGAPPGVAGRRAAEAAVAGLSLAALLRGEQWGLYAVTLLLLLRDLPGRSGIRHIVAALGQSLPILLQYLGFFLFFCVVLGLCGVDLFRGALAGVCVDAAGRPVAPLRHCRLDADPGLGHCRAFACAPAAAADPLPPNGTRYAANYDHLGHAFFALLKTATLEGWSATAVALGDTQGDGAGAHWAVSLFFLLVIIVCNWVIINLFIAVIVTMLQETWRGLDEKPAMVPSIPRAASAGKGRGGGPRSG